MGIELDAYTGLAYKLINITSPTTTVTIQELVDTIRDWEDKVSNIQHRKVINCTGKDDLGGGVEVGITMTLSSEWRIKFWSGIGQGIIKNGTLVPTSGYGGNPIEPTGGNDSIVLLNQVGGVISYPVISPEEMDDIAVEVWDKEDRGEKVDEIDTGVDELQTDVGEVQNDLGGIQTGLDAHRLIEATVNLLHQYTNDAHEERQKLMDMLSEIGMVAPVIPYSVAQVMEKNRVS